MNDALIIDQQAADVSHVEPDTPRTLAVTPTDPFALLVRAVEKGMDPAQLKALVDLQEQWRAARAKEAFAAAMNAVQNELKCIVRDALNDKTQSRFVRLETVKHFAKPVYTKHGFSLSFSEADSGKPSMANGQPWKRIVCLVRHVEGHSEEHWIDLPCDGIGPKGSPIGGMNAVQGAISTGSYGQRVLICNVFDITIADTDLDGNRPSYDNPEPDDRAPKAPSRSQRNAPQAVSREQCAELFAYWQKKYPTEGNDEYSLWVRGATRRGFSVFKSAEWTPDDYNACCRALNFDPEAQG